MKILIVEDDPFKLNQLRRESAAVQPSSVVKVATSLQEAMATLDAATFDFVLLDMAIPSHTSVDGSTDVYSQPVGGLDILLSLALSGRLERVIIVTQYPTVEFNQRHVPLSRLVTELRAEEIRNVKGVIRFSDDRPWQRELQSLLEESD